MGGTPSLHGGLVPFLDHETGTVYFLDVFTEELVGGATLVHYASNKSGNDVAHGVCAPAYPNVGVKVSKKFAPDECAPTSPARNLKDHTEGSPTSVVFFGVSESDQTPALFDLSKSAQSILPDFVLPGVSTSSSAFKALNVIFSSFTTQISTSDVSSTSDKGPDSLCFSYAQDLLSNSTSTATLSSDLPCLFVSTSFFSYWFDGFMPSRCLCALIILTILSNDPFDDVVPKACLSKYLKYAIGCLDLACTKAGLRIAKSIASVPATIAVTSPELLQPVDLCSSSGFRFSDGLCPSKMTISGTVTDLRTTSTSSLNSA